MGKIREFFNLLVIAVLISLSIIFIGAAFREEYPLWKNQKILEDLRSDVKAEETGDGNPGIDWEKLKKKNLYWHRVLQRLSYWVFARKKQLRRVVCGA